MLTDQLNKDARNAIEAPPSPTVVDENTPPQANTPPLNIAALAENLRSFYTRQVGNLQSLLEDGVINEKNVCELMSAVDLPGLSKDANLLQKCEYIQQETMRLHAIGNRSPTTSNTTQRLRCSSHSPARRSPLGASRAGVDKRPCKAGRCGCATPSFRLNTCTMETVVTILSRHYM